MEERLDDAINVLRSHCEPQLNMTSSGMEATIGSNQFVPTQPQSADASGISSQAPLPQQQDSVALPIDLPVKIERPNVPSVSSKILFFSNLMTVLLDLSRIIDFVTQKKSFISNFTRQYISFPIQLINSRKNSQVYPAILKREIFHRKSFNKN